MGLGVLAALAILGHSATKEGYPQVVAIHVAVARVQESSILGCDPYYTSRGVYRVNIGASIGDAACAAERPTAGVVPVARALTVSVHRLILLWQQLIGRPGESNPPRLTANKCGSDFRSRSVEKHLPTPQAVGALLARAASDADERVEPEANIKSGLLADVLGFQDQRYAWRFAVPCDRLNGYRLDGHPRSIVSLKSLQGRISASLSLNPGAVRVEKRDAQPHKPHKAKGGLGEGEVQHRLSRDEFPRLQFQGLFSAILGALAVSCGVLIGFGLHSMGVGNPERRKPDRDAEADEGQPKG